jgi:DUF1680 family protein
MKPSNSLSRRDFIRQSVSTLATGYALGRGKRSRAAGLAAARITPLRYEQVKLTGGPLKEQFDRIHAAYLELDNDRLLQIFRRRAGLPFGGEQMGGWYDWDGFAPGHSFGQYVSGLARFAAATGDSATRQKVQSLVEGFSATVDADGYSYANLKASTTFPAYCIDKNEIGLIDAYRYAKVDMARELLPRVIRGAVRYLPSRAIERDEAPRQAPYDESYTLPENLFITYEITGDPYFRSLASQFLSNAKYYDPLARGENVLPGLHAYSHVNSLSSGAKAYEVLGEQKYLRAVQNAWQMIEQTQQFASGGWGPNEAFVKPGSGGLGESLETSHRHFETPCGSYAHLKLARYLMGFTSNARYGDGIERVLYNTVLGARDPKGDGHFFYYSDYHAASQKTWFPDKWPCCSGTLPQVVADYGISSYFEGAEGLYVNLFTPSEVKWSWKGAPVKLTQTTNYPHGESSELHLELPSPQEFTLFIRMPGWLEKPAEIRVNGKDAGAATTPRTFAALHRQWSNHDTVQILLPFTFKTSPVDAQHPGTVALQHGPLMLVALQPELELPRLSPAAPGAMRVSPFDPAEYELKANPQSLRFLPFYRVKEENYTTYFQSA